jgi:fucose permease
MWGANFDNGFNVTSFVAAIIVMCYYCAYLLITYDIVNEDAED